MSTYTKLIRRSDLEAKKRCESKLQAISKASNLEMYISAPDGQLSAMVSCNGKDYILSQAQNYHDLLDILTAIRVYIAIMKISES